MGGFAIDTYDSGETPYVPGSPRVTLTIDGILLLARLGHLPDIPITSIQDRSKADNLAKALVCIQAGWLGIQCIARLADHLPVTFLEVNTVGHVVCATAIYGLWWYKPFDVYDPFLLTGTWVRPLCALMCTNSTIEGTPDRSVEYSSGKFDSIDATRQLLISFALQSHRGVFHTSERGNLLAARTVTGSISNWQAEDLGARMGTKPVIILGFLSAAYGGLHAAAWNGTFYTTLEATLWKISASVIAGSGFMLSLYMLIIKLTVYDDETLGSKFEALLILSHIFTLFYVLSRVFLIGESFASLRDLPVDAYYTPNWTQFIPHL